jgi:hypothetical protein
VIEPFIPVPAVSGRPSLSSFVGAATRNSGLSAGASLRHVFLFLMPDPFYHLLLNGHVEGQARRNERIVTLSDNECLDHVNTPI